MQYVAILTAVMKIKDIKTPVSAISGVGPQLAKVLAKVNVFTVGDLLQ